MKPKQEVSVCMKVIQMLMVEFPAKQQKGVNQYMEDADEKLKDQSF